MLNLLECTPIAQFAIDLDHRVIVWNKACEVLTGVTANEILGTDFQWKIFYNQKRPVLADLIVEQDYQKFLEIYGGKDPAQSDIVPNAWEATDYFDDINGKPRYIYFLAAPVFDEDGNMTGAVTTLQDVTQQKKLEMEMKKESEQLQEQYSILRSAMGERFKFCNIVGKSKQMQGVYDRIVKAASSIDSVVIHGESGVGKELVARAIHDISARKNAPFLPVNCGAISENLLENEFFGHVKGAFTGAYSDKTGFLSHANGGTLFLDEVGELSLNMQVKLLRAVEGGGYSPVGSNEVLYSDFRIVAASNRDLQEEVRKGRVRSDFFYRLYVIPVEIPPLRDRKEDLALLADHFFQQMGSKLHFDAIPGKDIKALYSYQWPGNVRELQNVLRRYLTLSSLDFMGGSTPDQPPDITAVAADYSGSNVPSGITLDDAVSTFEKRIIITALENTKWHRINAARKLGISRRTLYRKMTRHGLESTHNES